MVDGGDAARWLHLNATMRRLVRAVLAHQQDQLDDDATALFLEWQPSHLPLGHLEHLTAPDGTIAPS